MERFHKSHNALVVLLLLSFLMVITSQGSNPVTVGMQVSQPLFTNFATSDNVNPVTSSFLQGETDWVKLTPSTSPLARGYHSMAYDAESDVVVLFSGINWGADWTITYNDTWAYSVSTDTWTNRSPIELPPAAAARHAMAYDSKNDVSVLFGGGHLDNSPWMHAETWAYDYSSNTWTNRTPSVSPPGRDAHATVYDAQSERIIIFGGRTQFSADIPLEEYNESDFLHDVWAYDYAANSWTNVTPATGPHPAGRWYHCMTYDSKADRVLLFGGESYEVISVGQFYAGVMGDLWAFDLESQTWTNLTTATGPGPRCYPAMAYVDTADRTILYGGSYGAGGPLYIDFPLGDTWAFDYNTQTWTDMNSPNSPGRRMRHTLVYDNDSAQIVLFGGQLDDEWGPFNAETWTYTYQPNLPTAPQELNLTIGDGALDLEWLAPRTDAGSPITGYNIYRGQTSGDLSLYSQLGNVLVYSDTDVVPGVTYYYVVRAVNGVGEGAASDEVSETFPPPPPMPFLPILIGGGVVVLVLVVAGVIYLKKRS